MNEFWGKFLLNISVSLRHPGWSYRTCWDSAQREWESTYRSVYEDYLAGVPRETQLEEQSVAKMQQYEKWNSHDEKKHQAFVEAIDEVAQDLGFRPSNKAIEKSNSKIHGNSHRWASGQHPRNKTK